MKNSESQLESIKQELDNIRKELTEEIALNDALKKIIRDNKLEVPEIDILSDQERICIGGIRALLPFFEKGSMSSEDTKVFDLLHKNLMAIRNYDVAKNSKKKEIKNPKELIKLVKGSKK